MEPTLAPDEPVDLDNCAREPIHIPGSVQPRGVLLVVHDDVVVQVTANVAELLGRGVDDVLGHPLGEVLGTAAAAAVVAHAAAPGDVRDRNPVLLRLPDGTPWDAFLHHPPGTDLLAVELEPAQGAQPLTYTDTYQHVRGSIAALSRARSLTELYDVAAREVRRLTGFDRVMVYRFDADHNGEVVAEAKRADLNAFLGLHYPATDIPAQARALYEKNWIRLISDVGYTPSPLVPSLNPVTGAPLDLTHAVLRSVSPIHIEYLGNMGVTASMSISLLKDGALWGLIACHHYSGPHAPPHGIRAAAEFLGSVLSVRLVAQVEEDRLAAAHRVARELAAAVPDVAGALVLNLAEGDALVWLRREVARSVDWGGDPHNKAIARREGDSVRLSPRKSFERWRETVRGSSLPWTEEQRETATVLRRHAVEALYLRGLADSRAAEILQRTALPETLPQAAGWTIEARYSPGDGGRVGGDWYDVLTLPDGRLADVVGDVAGHGMTAASTMGQLRNALRGLLMHEGSPARAAAGLDLLAKSTLAGEMATVLVAVLDPATGRLEYVRAGHLPPLALGPDGSASWPPVTGTLPIGFVPQEPVPGTLDIPAGGGVVIFTDGLVEQRGVPLPDGLERLRLAFTGPFAADLDAVIAAVRDPASDDDATAVVLRRDRPA